MNKYTRNDLIDSLQEAEDEIIPLTSDSFDANSDYPSKSTISNEFGSWTKACKIAEVESGQVTEKSILHNIKSLYEDGEIENSEDFFQRSDTISPATFYKYFEGWRDAIDTANINAYTHYTEEDLLEFIREFESKYGYVSSRKFKYDDNFPTSSTITRRFDSWNNAVKSADIEPNSVGVAESEEVCGLKEELFGSNWYTQREQALERDSFKCQECSSEANLCVHHDKQRVTYRNSELFDIEESNVLENLVTLCQDCHYNIHGSSNTAEFSNSYNLKPRIV